MMKIYLKQIFETTDGGRLDRIFRLKRELELDLTYEGDYVILRDTIGLGIISMGYRFVETMDELGDDFGIRWECYAQEDDEYLSEGAKRIKMKLLDLVKRVEECEE